MIARRRLAHVAKRCALPQAKRPTAITPEAPKGCFFCDRASAFSACREAVRVAAGKTTDRNHPGAHLAL